MGAVRGSRFLTACALLALTASACRSGGDASRAGDPVIVAVGDIACDPADPSFNGGDGTTDNCQQAATSEIAIAANPTAVPSAGQSVPALLYS